MKKLIILISFILLINLVSAYTCYQETATTSTDCGGRSTGLYGTNWTFTNGTAKTGILYINYTIPPTALDSSLWYIKIGNSTTAVYKNYSMPECFSGSILQLRIFSYINQTSSPALTGAWGECYNSTDWQLVTDKTTILTVNFCSGGAVDDNSARIYDGDWNTGSFFDGNAVTPNWDANSDFCENDTRTLWEEAMNWNLTNLIVNDVNYTKSVLEGSTQTFKLNISYDSDYYTNYNVKLIYNSTEYPVTTSDTGNERLFTKSFSVPNVAAENNVSFYWNISLINSTSTVSENTSSYNQTITIISLDNCTTNTVLLFNFTLKDEESQAILNGNTYNSTIEIDLGLRGSSETDNFLNFTATYSSINNTLICSNVNLTNDTDIETYAQIRYNADTYEPEFYYLENYTLNNLTTPSHIDLFDLLTTDSTRFLVTYKDSSFLGVDSALLVLKRKYISEGLYKTVEMALTDESGQGILHLDEDSVDYQVYVYKNGELLSIFDNVVVYCEDSVIGDCRINLYETASATGADDFYTSRNIGYVISFNQTTKLVKTTFTILDGTTSTVSINVTKLDPYLNATLCSSQVSASSGTLTCDVNTSYGNVTFVVELYKDNDLIASEIYSIIEKATDIFGDNTVVLILTQFLTLSFLLIPSAIGIVFGMIMGISIGILLFYTSGAIVAGTAAFAWIIIALIIVVWKLHERGV